MPYPAELEPVFRHFITCEYASLTKTGAPITMPVTPYLGAQGTIDISTGLVYPAKAERARRNRQVALLFSEPTGSGLDNPHTVLVIGDATVRDGDLQANTDRYLRESMRKLPHMMSGFPDFLVKMQAWYWVRIWVEVTPFKVLWWKGGDLDSPPECWQASPGVSAPPSDPAPRGLPPKSWKEAPQDWRSGAKRAIAALGLPVLTMVGTDGYPYLMRARSVQITPEGFSLTMRAGMPISAVSRTDACLTFHRHPDRFTGQENMLFTGKITPRASGDLRDLGFTVERRVVDWSGGGAGTLSKLLAAISFLNAGIRLTPRLRQEAERRGQRVPEIRLP